MSHRMYAVYCPGKANLSSRGVNSVNLLSDMFEKLGQFSLQPHTFLRHFKIFYFILFLDQTVTELGKLQAE